MKWSYKDKCSSSFSSQVEIVYLLDSCLLKFLSMIWFVFFQSREQQLIHAHPQWFRISLDRITLLGRHIQLQRFVICFGILCVWGNFLGTSLLLLALLTILLSLPSPCKAFHRQSISVRCRLQLLLRLASSPYMPCSAWPVPCHGSRCSISLCLTEIQTPFRRSGKCAYTSDHPLIGYYSYSITLVGICQV